MDATEGTDSAGNAGNAGNADATGEAGTPGTAVGRRAVLRSLTVGGAVAAAGPLAGTIGGTVGGTVGARPASAAGPELWSPPSAAGAPPVHGPHLTFGADPSREMVVSWSTATPVRRPRALLGAPDGGFGKQVDAETRTYTDGPSGREVYVHHARLRGLRADRQYVYAAVHDGGLPEMGTFRTAPRGRAPFTFTSFGDQATPTVTWAPTDSGGYSVAPNGISSPAAGDIVAGIEQVGPLFHLLNGDLCYANISPDRVRTWNDFFANNSRSARFRPWMPAAGNHENEKQNGPLGFEAYQSRFLLPPNGDDPAFAGLWYAFTVGSVRIVVIQGDEVAHQDAGDTYVHGYSGGRQRRWLEAELRATRADRRIDWVVVCVHQPTISSAAANGPDLGLREQFGPLFDAYEVDLVVCGHDHHYERSLPVRGVVPGSETLTPNPVGSDTSRIDTSTGTVHMVLGGGGTSFNSNTLFYSPARARVITGVGPVGANGKRPSIYTFEDAPWVGVRDPDHPFGFAAFTVDPGTRPGGTTQLQVTYYTVARPDGGVAPLESFTLHRPRRDTI